MYRPFVTRIASICILLAVISPCFARQHKTSEATSFSFLEISDIQQTAQGNIEPLRKWVGQVMTLNPRPAFVVIAGNLTNSGRPEEYERLRTALQPLEAAGIKVYAVPGNRDVRWSPNGREEFVRQISKPYQSFDYAGNHFILLDSTVLLEHWGHFDSAELEWLTRDLRRVRATTPVFLFMHHWIGRDLPSKRMIDNEYDLIPLLKGHNVVAIFNGHGRQDLTWKTNGVETLMARGLYDGSCYWVKLSNSVAEIDRFTREKGEEPVSVVSLPLVARAHPSSMKAGWDDPDNPYLVRKRPTAMLDPRAVMDDPDKESAQYRIDDGPFKTMTRDPRDIWQDQFSTAPLAIGIHTADLRLTTSNDVTFLNELIFEVERDSREPTRGWAINLDGPIQSSPLLSQNTLYVSCLDGKLYAIDIHTGKRRWSFDSKGSFLASPVLDNGALYIGSTDHTFYSLDAETGHRLWRFDTGSPVFATAAITQDVVCIGSAGKIYGLDEHTGSLKWSQPAGSFFQSRALAGNGTFYLGGWDNTVYALAASDGTVRWTKKMGASFEYSPAISSPMIANGRLYICSNDGLLHALNTSNGHEEWTVHAPAGEDPFGYSSPVALGATLYLAGLGDNGDVYALDLASGNPRWHVATGQPIYDSSPRLAPDGKSLAIMGVRGHVAVLSTQNGKPLWSYELGPGNIFSTPEYDGQTIYTVTMDNDVQAIDGPSAR